MESQFVPSAALVIKEDFNVWLGGHVKECVSL